MKVLFVFLNDHNLENEFQNPLHKVKLNVNENYQNYL